MARAAGILVRDGQVALIRRVRPGRTYYLFPGGQVEPGEAPEAALRREIKEELGLDVSVGLLVAEVTFEGKPQLHYLVEAGTDTFGSATGLEMLGLVPGQAGTYEAVWMPIANLATEAAYPKFVVNLILASLEQGWPTETQYFIEDL